MDNTYTWNMAIEVQIKALLNGWERGLTPRHGELFNVDDNHGKQQILAIPGKMENGRGSNYGCIAEKLTVEVDERGILLIGTGVPMCPFKVVLCKELTIQNLAHPVSITPDKMKNLDSYSWLQGVIAEAHQNSIPPVIGHTEPSSVLTVSREFEWSPIWMINLHRQGQGKIKEIATLDLRGLDSNNPYVVLIVGGRR